jgi:hypothetical protein
MTIYTVHRRPDEPAEKAVFVRDGFSFGAFMFTFFWAVWRRMWLVAALLLLIEGAIALAGRYLGVSDLIVSMLGFGVALIFGFEARSLWRISLAASGRPEVAVTTGHRLEDAELRYFSALPQSAAAPAVKAAPPRSSGQVHDTLGLFGNT